MIEGCFVLLQMPARMLQEKKLKRNSSVDFDYCLCSFSNFSFCFRLYKIRMINATISAAIMLGQRNAQCKFNHSKYSRNAINNHNNHHHDILPHRNPSDSNEVHEELSTITQTRSALHTSWRFRCRLESVCLTLPIPLNLSIARTHQSWKNEWLSGWYWCKSSIIFFFWESNLIESRIHRSNNNKKNYNNINERNNHLIYNKEKR